MSESPFSRIASHKVVENIVRKGEIACNKQFLLFSQCFLPYMVLIFHFKCTFKCRLRFVSIWTSLKFCRLVMGYPYPEILISRGNFDKTEALKTVTVDREPP